MDLFTASNLPPSMPSSNEQPTKQRKRSKSKTAATSGLTTTRTTFEQAELNELMGRIMRLYTDQVGLQMAQQLGPEWTLSRQAIFKVCAARVMTELCAANAESIIRAMERLGFTRKDDPSPS